MQSYQRVITKKIVRPLFGQFFSSVSPAVGIKPLQIEVYPPHTLDKTKQLFAKLADRMADGYVNISVVDKNTQLTQSFVRALCQQFPDAKITPHLTIAQKTLPEIHQTLDLYAGLNIKKLLCLRGDQVYVDSKLTETPADNASKQAISVIELIQLAKTAGFAPLAACYPERHPLCLTDQENIQNALDKQQAGCVALVSQCVYDVSRFKEYVQKARAAGVILPIIPTVMPMMKHEKLVEFAKQNHLTIPVEWDPAYSYHDLISELSAINPTLVYSTLNNFELLEKLLAPLQQQQSCHSRAGGNPSR